MPQSVSLFIVTDSVNSHIPATDSTDQLYTSYAYEKEEVHFINKRKKIFLLFPGSSGGSIEGDALSPTLNL